MTGMSFDHQPHLAALGKLQGVPGRQGKVNVHLDSTIDVGGNNHVAPLQGNQPPSKHVTGAESYGLYDGQQNIARPNPYTEVCAWFRANQGRLQQDEASLVTARQRPSR